jgi:hypothetical protein
MATSAQKEWKKIKRESERQGWRWKATKSGEQGYAPDGVGIVTVHKTPSDSHALDNTLSLMRRYGFKWKGH